MENAMETAFSNVPLWKITRAWSLKGMDRCSHNLEPQFQPTSHGCETLWQSSESLQNKQLELGKPPWPMAISGWGWNTLDGSLLMCGKNVLPLLLPGGQKQPILLSLGIDSATHSEPSYF